MTIYFIFQQISIGNVAAAPGPQPVLAAALGPEMSLT